MIVFPNCKLNLGLNIIRKRNDGYHDLETIFYPLALTDSLEIIESKSPGKPLSPFTSTGLSMEGKSASNSCVKAYRILKKDFPEMPGVEIHLHKVIPSGAGLGGGSADGSFTLLLLNEMFELKLSQEQLIKYALQIGSDCPFFIINKPCFATGRGEIMEEVAVNLSDYKFVLVNPGIHINTGRAFLDMKPGVPAVSVKEIINTPIEMWKDNLYNDFEKPVFLQHPEIADIKNQLYQLGAIYAAMTGSGSTLFGIFPKEKQVQLSFPTGYFVKELPCSL